MSGVVVARVSADGGSIMNYGPVDDPSDAGDREHNPDHLFVSAEVAALLNIEPGTWRAYVHRGQAPPADDPDLDRPANRRMPRWKYSTIHEWNAARPGSGSPRIKRRS